MKKNILFLLAIMALCLLSVKVDAAVSVYSSSKTVEKGSSVTFYIKITNAASWQVKGTSTGATSGCSINEADATGKNSTQTFKATCKATEIGTITFIASGNYADESGNKSYISGKASVTVVKPREPDSNNYLSSLKIEGYELSPAFDKDTLEYNVTVPSTVNEVVINANKASNYASLNGTGTFPVDEGANVFEIKVISETDIPRIYRVNVNVEDLNPIEVNIDNVKYTIVKNAKNLVAPNNYVASTLNINDVEVPAYINENLNITLVPLKDSEGNIVYFMYNNGNYSKYIELTSDSLVIMPKKASDMPFKGFNKIDFNGYEVYKYKNLDNYYLIYGMNVSDGTDDFYLYDKNNNTYQLFNKELFNTLKEDNRYFLYMLLASGGIILIMLILLIAVSVKLKKINKKDNKKEDKKKAEEEIKKEESVVNEKVKKEEIKEEVKQDDKLTKKELKKKNKEQKKDKKETDDNKKNNKEVKEDTQDYFDIFNDN